MNATSNPIARAADLLRECAAELKISHTIGGSDVWTGEDEAKAAHDEYVSVAEALERGTPAAAWRANGEPDPHAGHYDGERAALCMGNLTDDELANGAFMNYDMPPNLQGIMAGTHHSPIAWMTAVKDRIRWLSRALERARAAAPAKAEPWMEKEARNEVEMRAISYASKIDDTPLETGEGDAQ